MANPLLDKEFLSQLDKQQTRTVFARIIALDLKENPIDQIEGGVTEGSINIDGSSAIRRTCSITLVSEAGSFIEKNWALKSKFRLEIGLGNDINPNYPKIIWFKQGVYGITSFGYREEPGKITISISGKDKMAYLNGELGGNIFAQHDFGTYDETKANGDIESHNVKIFDIVREAVHEYGQEPYSNIIINDLDRYGYELWDYRGVDENGEGSELYYLYSNNDNSTLRNMTLNGDQVIYENVSNPSAQMLKNLKDEELYWRNNLLETNPKIFKTGGSRSTQEYKIAKIKYGETAGYHKVDLVYPGELILGAGETISSLLDKVVKTLGDFEYFYDIDGHFVFQKKKTYVQGLFSPLIEGGANPSMVVTPYSYKFEDSSMITNCSVTPDISGVKNDFAVWGTRKGIDGAELPIHARYALAHKPQSYHSGGRYEGIVLRFIAWREEVITEENQNTKTYYRRDERPAQFPNGGEKYSCYIAVRNPEIGEKYVYQAYKDMNEAEIKAEYAEKIARIDKRLSELASGSEKDREGLENSKAALIAERDALIYTICEIGNSGKLFNVRQGSGYACAPVYERDASGNYSQFTLSQETDLSAQILYKKIPAETYDISKYDWREILYQITMDYYFYKHEAPRTGYEPFYADMQAFWRNIFDPLGLEEDDFITTGKYAGWHRNALYYPENLVFWIDFLDTYGELNNFSIDTIGHRPKVETANEVTAIAYRSAPDVEFKIIGVDDIDEVGDLDLSIFQIPESAAEIFSVSSQGLSAMDKIDDLVYKHVCINETITLSALPVYYLQPNTRIYVYDEKCAVDGDYIISRISFPLSYSGQMSVTATKVINQLN